MIPPRGKHRLKFCRPDRREFSRGSNPFLIQRTLKCWLLSFAAWMLVAPSGASFAAPANFETAKVELRQHVYHDQTHSGSLGTIYCGCDWQWLGRSGGRVDFASCGYRIRAQEHRAVRIEWEHLVPASNFGRARQCWQHGGRANCQGTDPVFNEFEADMHNLTVSVGEINADRSNYRFGVLPGGDFRHGACNFKVDFRRRVAEPRDEIKGLVARFYFYVHDRYDLRMSDQQQRLLMAWDRNFPVTPWERARDNRIAQRMGHSNLFVTGERRWTLGHRNSAKGLNHAILNGRSALLGPPENSADGAIRGNRNSKVYHLPAVCPGYDQVAPWNIVEFQTKAGAQAAGYRKAGNCN